MVAFGFGLFGLVMVVYGGYGLVSGSLNLYVYDEPKYLVWILIGAAALAIGLWALGRRRSLLQRTGSADAQGNTEQADSLSNSPQQ